jgi:hypothetical protein
VKFPLCFSILVVSVFSCGCLSANAGDIADSAVSKQSEVDASSPGTGPVTDSSEFMIPGPLRSFLRMAGISQKITPEEVLPLLSRNVFMQGYQGTKTQTEFLILLKRYVVQAKELSALAATDGTIRVSNCDDANPLLHILGYRIRPNCGGPDTSLQTADAERAFLTIDSGFPLSELEQTLQGGKPFVYPYSASAVPVNFTSGDWTMASGKNSKETSGRDLVDTIISDPAVARLYWAVSRMDSETTEFLQRSIGINRLLPYAGVLDFYGSRLCVRANRVIVPGGPAAESAWKDLVGTSPASPAAFVQNLLARDKGWLAAYFDVLSRVSRSHQDYFTEAHRLRLFTMPCGLPILRPTPQRGRLDRRLGCSFWLLGFSGSPPVNRVFPEILKCGETFSGKRTQGACEVSAARPVQFNLFKPCSLFPGRQPTGHCKST